MAYILRALVFAGCWTGVAAADVNIEGSQIISSLSTCGFKSGDAQQSRTANTGYVCTTNTPLSLWGFCTTAATNINGCGLAGYCVDSYTCSTGCGPFPSRTDIT